MGLEISGKTKDHVCGSRKGWLRHAMSALKGKAAAFSRIKKLSLVSVIFSFLFLFAAPLVGNANAAEWITQFGTTLLDTGRSIAVDTDGNSYVTGTTYGDLGGTTAGGYDVFVAKYNANGSQVWIRQIGTIYTDQGYGIAVDSSGNSYITGRTGGDLGGTGNAGGDDVFVAKYDTNGSQVWVRQFGTTGSEVGRGIAVDSGGNSYIIGNTTGDFGVGGYAGEGDAFIAKYNTSGSQVWIRQIGTTQSDSGYGIAVDSSGNSYITGGTGGNLAGSNAGSIDVFVAKYDTNGNMQWLRQFGSITAEYGFGIALDSTGSSYVTGYTFGNLDGTNAGGDDVFIAKYDTDGGPVWISQFGTTVNDRGYGIAVDSSGNSYVTGYTFGNLDGTNAGFEDVFVAKYDTNGSQVWVRQFGTTMNDFTTDIAVDSGGNSYITGYTWGDLGGTNAGSYDIFIWAVLDESPPSTTASPSGATYNVDQSVALTCTDDDSGCADTYYTTDGIDPTTSSPSYSTEIDVTEGTTDLKFFSTDNAGNEETVKTESYLVDSAVPFTSASPPGGTYINDQMITLTCDDGGGTGCATTYYTDNGTTPTTGSPIFSGDYGMSLDTTLRFFSVDLLGNEETPKTEVYVIDSASAPTYGGYSIINGSNAFPNTTTSANVTIALSANDNVGITGYYISESISTPLLADFIAIESTPTLSMNVPYTLSGGDGNYNLYIYYRDAAGNISLWTGGGYIYLSTGSASTGAWIKQFGMTGDDYGRNIALDSAGNSYVTGYTEDDLVSTGYAGNTDVYVTKYDVLGNLQWVEQFGTADYDEGVNIAVDSGGNVYVTGFTDEDSGFYNAGGSNAIAFIRKYDTYGNLLWSDTIDSTASDKGLGITLDSFGNSYVTGTTTGDLYGTIAGATDVFIAKYDSSGSQVWIRQFGTNGWDEGEGIGVDSLGNSYIIGSTSGDLYGTNQGAYDVFIAKYDTNGAQQWIRQIGTVGTSFSEYGYDIAVDSTGNSYITGDTLGDFTDTGNAWGFDVFIAKYDTDGGQLWINQLSVYGGYGNGIDIDSAGNSYVTGFTYGDLAGLGIFPGYYGPFIAKHDTDGNQIWINQLASSSMTSNDGYGIAVNSTGDSYYVAGRTNDDLDGGGNAGGYDAYIWKVTDTTPPADGTISINGGATSTSYLGVMVSVTTTDDTGVTGYYLSENSATPSLSDFTTVSSTTDYFGTISFVLSSGAGLKTVNVWYRDLFGNISSPVSDTITLEAGASAGTGISGFLSTDMILPPSGNPYIVTGSLIVDAAATLTIEPGVTMKFDNGNSLLVNGGLIARGTGGNEITFTSNQPTSAPGDWGNISFTNTSVDAVLNISGSNTTYISGSIIENAVIEYGGGSDGGGIKIAASSPFINKNIVRSSISSSLYGGGIYVDGYSSPIITSNIITQNSTSNTGWGGGIYTAGGTITDNIIADNIAYQGGGVFQVAADVTDNTIINNSTYNSPMSGLGGGLYSANPGAISGNLISNNSAVTGGGIYLNSADPQAVISNNNLINNSIYELYNDSTAFGVLAENNWWGTDVSGDIADSIFDQADGTNSTSAVDYSPFLAAPDTSAPISPPANVISTVSAGNVNLTWDANTEADVEGYRVYWDADDIYPYANVTDIGNVTNHSLSALADGTYIVVTAYDSDSSYASGAVSDDPDTLINEIQTGGNESWFSNAIQADLTPPTTTASATTGDYNLEQDVILTCDDGSGSGCAATYYTTNGSVPTTSSTLYSGAITINSDTWLRFFSVDNVTNSESAKSETYTFDYDAPVTTATPAGGIYSSGQNVALSCDDSGGTGCVTTYYTDDGTTPDTNSTVYSTTIAVDIDTTLQFFSVDALNNTESVKSEVYLIDSGSAPTEATLTINAGSTITTSTVVTISLEANDSVGITGYYLSESSTTPLLADFIAVSSTTSLSLNVSFTLSSGDGDKTVYVWYRDAAGGISTVASYGITLDESAAIPSEWIAQFGSTGGDYGNGIAVDSSGNSYVVGGTSGDLGGTSAGGADVYIAKYDVNGNPVWIKQFGTADYEEGLRIAVDSSGNSYVTGYTTGDLGGINAGRNDGFVAKYDANGNQQWIRQFGTVWNDEGYGIAVDSSGNSYVTGDTSGDFGVGGYAGGGDAFIAKYDTDGNQLWIKQFGTMYVDGGDSITVDSSGNSYVMGGTSGDLGGTSAGGYDVYIAKYDTDGGQLWIRQFGSTSSDYGRGLALDSAGNSYISGGTAGDLDGTNAGGADVYIAKYDTDGGQLWIKQFGTASDDYGRGIGVDSSGNSYVMGHTDGDLGGSNAGNNDVFVTKYDTDGSQMWIRQIGTAGYDYGNGIAVDSAGKSYVTGETNGNLGGTNLGLGYDVFIWALVDDTAPTTTASPPGGIYNTDQLVILACDDGSGYGCAGTYFTTDGATPDTNSPYTTAIPITEGTTELQFFSIDYEGNSETVKSENYIIDLTDPVVDAGTDKNTNAQFAQDAIVTDTNALTYQWSMQSGPGTVTFGTPTTEDTTISADTNGTYVIRLTATDAASNSAFDEMSLEWDLNAPTSGSISINGGAASTTYTGVMLSLSASDNTVVTGYYVSENPATPALNAFTTVASNFELLFANVSFVLSSGAGTKTVYAWYRDAAGNISSPVSEVIDLALNATVGTQISGTVSSNTSWMAEGGPFIVTGTIGVSNGVTLTIEPGTTLKFNSTVSLQVNGELIARGSGGNVITFTSNQTEPWPGSWDGISFGDTSVDATFDVDGNYTGGSIIENAIIEYGDGITAVSSSPYIKSNGVLYQLGIGITANWSSATISDNVIMYNGGSGIATYYDSPTIVNNIIMNNSSSNNGGGIYSYGGSPVISNNFIMNNSASGGGGGISIDFEDFDLGTLSYNTITNNSASFGGGIYIPSSTVLPTIANNNLSGNSIYEMYNGSTALGVNAENNWWGTAVSGDIAISIYDSIDDNSLGVVDYNPFLIAADTTAPISPPSNLSATNIGGTINLAWDANLETDVQGYRVYWGADSVYTYVNVADVGNVTSYPLPGLAEGTYIAVTAYDSDSSYASGTVSDDPDTLINEIQTGGNESWFSNAVLADMTAPSTTASPTTGTYNSEQNVTLDCIDDPDPGSGCAATYYTEDGTTVPTTASTAYTGPIIINSDTELRFFSVDNLANSESYKSETYTFDYTPPGEPIVSGTTPTNNATPTWSWTSGDNGGNGTYRYRLDNPDLSTGYTETLFGVTSYTPSSPLAEGFHTLYVIERDDVGNWSTAGSFTSLIDTIAPTTTASPTGGTYNSSQPVTLTCNDGAGIVSGCTGTYYTTDGTDPTTASTLYSGALILNTTTTLMFFSTDNAGNSGSIQTQTYVIDSVLPTVSITDPPSGSLQTLVYSISGTASDDNSGVVSVELQITDGTYYVTAAQGFTTTPTWITTTGTDSWSLDTSSVNWADFQYTITARATDAAGNVSTETTDTFTYNEVQSPTSLSINLSAAVIQYGETVDIIGKLSPYPDRGQNMQGQDIVITVTSPSTATPPSEVFTYTVTTNDWYGNYITDLPAFTDEGVWYISASFAQTPVYYGSDSVVNSVYVGQKVGYAIIVEGKIPNDEGLLSHNLTTNRIYQKFIDRNFDPEDIWYLNYDDTQTGVDALTTKQAVQNAITGWAQTKMNESPAPLYLVMINHGNINEFHVDTEVISPTELASWFDTLELGLSADRPAALEKERIIILGYCYSGSFIPALSKPGSNRVVVVSAADDEESYKGSAEGLWDDNTTKRSGEFFMEEFFTQLGRGYSLRKSFEVATEKTEQFTDSGTTDSVNQYFDSAVQHPLLDDNGDGIGTNEISEGSADGVLAAGIYLGSGATYTNAGNNPAEITGVTDTQYLLDTETSSTLWASVNDNNRADPVWAEIRSPSIMLSTTGSGVSEQVEIDLVKNFLTYNATDDRWDNTYSGFDIAGAWDIYYFVKDSVTLEVSTMAHSVVYKNYDGNSPPTSFGLLSPANNATTQTVLIFDWEDSSDSDGFTYNLVIASDSGFTDVVYKKERISTSTTYVDDSAGLTDLTTYYWKVEAVDGYGAVTTSSQAWSFNTNNTNASPGFIIGLIYNAATFSPIVGATITADLGGGSGGEATSIDGGAFIMSVPSGTVTLTATIGGYNDAIVSGVNILSGGTTSVNIAMTSDVVKPQAPTVSALSGNTQVTLSWGDVSGATSYNIYWSTDSGVTTSSTQISGVTSPYIHTGLTNGQEYFYIVTANNPGGEGLASSEVSATPQVLPPIAPTGVSAAYSDTQVTVEWGSVTNADSYNIYWSTDSGVTTGTGIPIYDVTSPYTHTGITNGTPYYYIVTAVNAGGESEASDEVSATPQIPAPIAPDGVSAAPGDTQITVSWDSVADAVSYNIYWSNSTGVTTGNGTEISNVTSPYTDTGLTNDDTYYYIVTAVNAGGESSASLQVSATPQVPPVNPPSGLSAASGDGQVELNWTPTSDAFFYYIYWSNTSGVTTSNGTQIGILAPASSYTHTSLTNGDMYYYIVTAIDASGRESSPSNEAFAIPLVPQPAAPAGVSATPGSSQVDLNWTEVSEAQVYSIYWSMSPGVTIASGTRIALSAPASSYTHTGLSNGTTYYYIVTAVNGGGESSASSEVSTTPQAPIMAELVYPANANECTGSSVTLKWNGPDVTDSDTLTYYLYTCQNSDFSGCTPIELTFSLSKAYTIAQAGAASGLLSLAVIFIGGIKGRNRFITFTAVLLTTTLIVACGGGGGGESGGGTSPPPSKQTVAVSGNLYDTMASKPKPNQTIKQLHAVSDWSGATIQIIDSSGTVIGTTIAGSDGSFSVEVPPGTNYVVRASTGNLVLKSFIASATTDQSGVNVDPESSAVVKVLGLIIGNVNIGEEGESIVSVIVQIDVSSKIAAITESSDLVNIAIEIEQDIADNYDPNGTTDSVGSASTAGDSTALTVAESVAETTIPSCNGSGVDAEFGYTVTGLNSGSTYYWKVTTRNGNGEEASSDVWSFRTQ